MTDIIGDKYSVSVAFVPTMEPPHEQFEMLSDQMTVIDLPPIPIEVHNLTSFVKSQRVTYGKRNFDKIITVGVIKECVKNSVRELYQYTIADPNDENSSIQAFKYYNFAARDDRHSPVMFADDTKVFLAGRLTRIDGVEGIGVLAMRELEDEGEYECIVLESKLAMDFHVKASKASNTRRSNCVSASTSSERMMVPLSASLLASPSALKKEDEDSTMVVMESTSEDCPDGMPKDSFEWSSIEHQSTFDWSQ